MTPRHLYLHVPFCVRRCSYCDFAVTVESAPPVGDWVAAVTTELDRLAVARGWDTPWPLETLYCGGGTPSLLGPAGMELLQERLSPLARLEAGAEWTCEANPESFTPEVARGWARAGVNRVSLGAQTFDARALRWMGRLHGPEGPAAAVEAARGAGIDNVSVDLIFGLPTSLGRDWEADLRRALALEPDHLSLYGLTAEPRTPLGRLVAERREQLADEEVYAAEYLGAVAFFETHGLEAYEVSNFARPGRRSRHNQAYWQGHACVGLGPGAHSQVPPVRWWNCRDWGQYAVRLRLGESVVEGREEIAGEAAELERVWLGLRTREGLAAAELSEGQLAKAGLWAQQGWAVAGPARVRLTPEGWLRLDSLAVAMVGGEGTTVSIA